MEELIGKKLIFKTTFGERKGILKAANENTGIILIEEAQSGEKEIHIDDVEDVEIPDDSDTHITRIEYITTETLYKLFELAFTRYRPSEEGFCWQNAQQIYKIFRPYFTGKKCKAEIIVTNVDTFGKLGLELACIMHEEGIVVSVVYKVGVPSMADYSYKHAFTNLGGVIQEDVGEADYLIYACRSTDAERVENVPKVGVIYLDIPEHTPVNCRCWGICFGVLTENQKRFRGTTFLMNPRISKKVFDELNISYDVSLKSKKITSKGD